MELGNEIIKSKGGVNNSSPTKVERKIIEKNRRNHMKKLYSILNSLLPHQTSMEPLSVPDQIDAAVDYIKSLQKRIKECEEKKQKLIGRKRSLCATKTSPSLSSKPLSPPPPQIHIHIVDSALQIFLTTGIENQFLFQDVIGILNQEGAQVENATYSMVRNSIFHTVHAKVANSADGEKMMEKLKNLVYRSSIEEDLSEKPWDLLDSHSQIWNFPAI